LFGFGLGLKSNYSTKGFRLGRVHAKPKNKKMNEILGQGQELLVDSVTGSEPPVGCGSDSDPQRPERTTTIELDGGGSTPTISELSGSSEGAGFCLMATNSASEGHANFSGPDTSAPASASEDLGVLMPPKMVVGQGEHVDVGFLKRGFLKSPMDSGAVPVFVASVDPNRDPASKQLGSPPHPISGGGSSVLLEVSSSSSSLGSILLPSGFGAAAVEPDQYEDKN
jgi:hypothetical protein